MSGTALNFTDRIAGFKALEGEKFDILIIGAGITGCGIARDAAMRGMRVALVDAADIGAGTSSRSSKLIHGGIRYMAQGDLGVVREAATERRILRKIAPHLSLTTLMVVPARSKASLSALRAALWSYEKLGAVDKHERHLVWDMDRLKAEEPYVSGENFVGAVVYPEYLTDDFRLTLANARSAAGAGAVVVTYAVAKEIIIEKDKAMGAIVKSTLPGDENMARVRSRLVVNAAGPWVDAVRLLEDSGAGRKLQLTKGIHIVVSRERLPIRNTITKGTKDKRGVFAIPRGRFVYIGNTDTFYPEPVYSPEISREDIDYLIDNISAAFKTAPLKYEDIIALWSGLRPLLGEVGKKPSEISRRNEVIIGPHGMMNIAGGKLTSYRSMAERLVDQAENRLGLKHCQAPVSDKPLPGGDFTGTFGELKSRIEGLGLDSHEAERAAMLYGSEAPLIFVKDRGIDDEVRFAVLNEGALTLEDYWMRRSARARFDTDGGLASLEGASKRMGKLLKWSRSERRRQVEACKAIRNFEMEAIRG
jgi:glycerol-3-phosphate dehydrogenase